MIGKPHWFKRRKYGGWGIHPKTWQGWVYIAVILIPFIILQALPFWDNKTRVIFTIVWIAFLLIDVLDIMFRMKKDEREQKHEAIAERNAMWIMIVILSLAIVYQVITSALNQAIKVDWWIVAALFIGMIVKAISNIYLDKRN